MLDTAADLERQIQNSGGVEVEFHLIATYGHLDDATPVIGELLQVRGARKSVVVATGVLTGLAIDEEIEVDGEVYTVRDFGSGRDYGTSDDGALTRVLLA